MARRRPLSKEGLVRAANRYLARYVATEASLRRVLQRHVDRRLTEEDAIARQEARQQWGREIDALIARVVEAGLVDDVAYAEARTRSLRRKGKSSRAIRRALWKKGVSGEIIDAAVRTEPAVELASAARYVRKRRFGPYRPQEQREERRRKDAAAVCRAGFPPALAFRVVDAEDPAQIEAWMRAGTAGDGPW